MDTGVAPSAASTVPKPRLMIMICTTWLAGERVFTRATTRARAPVSAMRLTMKMEVPTIRVIGKEATAPAALIHRRLGRGEAKARAATARATTQPTIPAMSAGLLAITRRRKIAMTGTRARMTSSIGKRYTLFSPSTPRHHA